MSITTSRRHVFSAFVAGIPKPQGSKAYKGHRGGVPILVESSKALPAWRRDVSQVIEARCLGNRSFKICTGPVQVLLTFYMPRPKSVSQAKRPLPVVMPDLDKLIRAVGDCLSKAVVLDDSQIVEIFAKKRYAEGLVPQPGVDIAVYELEVIS